MSSKQPFLSLVAADILSRFGTDLANVILVFPSRRARLFFNNYLFQHAGVPVWAPQYFTIDELFEQAATLHAADPVKLVCELYKAYIEVYNSHASTPSSETLDEFYFFGEILLTDFNDIDKSLVNPKLLFSNLQDLDQLKDDFSHLSESQIEALSRYFKQVFQGETSLQAAFWSIWSILGEVYDTYKKRLKEEQVAYPGMLMRSVLEDEKVSFGGEKYVFVGFNILNKCEETLFRRLKEKALFYWDADNYYLDTDGGQINEAGTFIAKNIRKFGSALDVSSFDSFLDPEKEITIIASPSSSGQAAAIPGWIDSLLLPKHFTEPNSAIVLCNERILPTVMHSIPHEKVENVNITMGFPITQTPVCSFIQVLTEMQVKGFSGKAFRYKYILPVLRHPYVQLIFPEAKEIEKKLLQGNIFFPTPEILGNESLFKYTPDTPALAEFLMAMIRQVGKAYENIPGDADVYGGLYQESVFRAYQVINRLSGLLSSGELNIEKVTFLRLIKKLFSVTQVPFHGEPVKGLQVMGVLETRTLDFDHLIMLDVNEGFMPGGSSDNTFIPQFLRKHFEMDTIEHKEAIYAYHFYRLMQRANKVTLVYNTDKTALGKAEMSRFILQLITDPRLNIKRFGIQSVIKPVQTEVVEVVKTEALMRKIKEKYDLNTSPEAYTLSPSALNVLIDCSLHFYLRYVEELKTTDNLKEELDSSIFGTIFHKAAELLYREIGKTGDSRNFKPFQVHKEDLEAYLKYPHRLDKLVNRAFSEEYFKGRPVDMKQYNGEQLINFRVIRHMLKRLIEFDKRHAPFYIYGLEHRVSGVFNLKLQHVALKIGGIIDRLEEKDETLYIVDYKTSGTAKTLKAMEELAIQKELRASHIFQTFTYASILTEAQDKGRAVVPSLLYLQEAGKEDYSPVIEYQKEPIFDFRELDSLFREVFEYKISELFDPSIPFQQTKLTSICSYCDFKNLCNR